MKAFAAAGSFDVFSCGMRTRFDCIRDQPHVSPLHASYCVSG